jgi:hypothetical protein
VPRTNQEQVAAVHSHAGCRRLAIAAKSCTPKADLIVTR